MPDTLDRSRLLALSVLVASPCIAGTARAELPEPAEFTVSYHVTDENGEVGRELTDDELASYVNRARCECGQQVGINLRMNAPAPDPTQQYNAFVGTECAIAETSLASEFRRCGQLAAELAPVFEQGLVATFHPAFLSSGVDPWSPSRRPGAPDTILAGGCGNVAGESGLWMCMPNENSAGNCQSEEFFIKSDDALTALSGIPPLHFDFIPPLVSAEDLAVEPGNGSAELHWEVPTYGDIQGFRVLCEEVASGAGWAYEFKPPALDAIQAGTHYYTAGNLCGGQPFSTVATAPTDVTDPNTCGNGVVEAGEACDDGTGNGPENMCDDSCQLRVSASLHALAWSHVCSDHLPFTTNSVVIDGLANGKTYNFVLVAYDLAGNPKAQGQVLSAKPDASLPDLGGDDGGGEGCACAADEAGGSGLLAMSLGTLFALGRRRRPRR